MRKKIFLTLAILLAHTTLSAQTTIQTEFNRLLEYTIVSKDPIVFYSWLNQQPPQQVNMLSSANIVDLATLASIYEIDNADYQINPAVIQNLNPTALSEAITTIATNSTIINSVYPLALLVSKMSVNQWTPSVIFTFLDSLKNAANLPPPTHIVSPAFIQDLQTLGQMFAAQGLTNQSSANSIDYNLIVSQLIKTNSSLASILLNGVSPPPFTAQTVEAVLNQGSGINLAFIQSLPANVIIEIDHDYRNSGNGFTQFESLLTSSQRADLGEFPSAHSALWNQSTNQWITLLQNENTSPAIVQLIVSHLAADPTGSQFLYMIKQPPGQLYAFNSTMAHAIIPSISSTLLMANMNSIPKAYLSIIAPALTSSQVNALLTTPTLSTDQQAIIQALTPTQWVYMLNNLTTTPALLSSLTTSQIINILNTRALNDNRIATILPNQSDMLTKILTATFNIPQWPAIIQSLSTQQLTSIFATHMPASILSSIATHLTDAQFNDMITHLNAKSVNLVPYLTDSQANDLSLQITKNPQANQIEIIQAFTPTQLAYLINQPAEFATYRWGQSLAWVSGGTIWHPNPQEFTTEEAQAIIPYLTSTQLIQTLPNLNSTALQIVTPDLTLTQLASIFTTHMPASILGSIITNLTDAQFNYIMTNLNAELVNLVPQLTNLQANDLSLQIPINPQANQIKIIQAFTPTQLAYLINQPTELAIYPQGQAFALLNTVWVNNSQAFTAKEAQAIIPYLTITQVIQTLPNIDSTALQMVTPNLTLAQVIALLSSSNTTTNILPNIIPELTQSQLTQVEPMLTPQQLATVLALNNNSITTTTLATVFTAPDIPSSLLNSIASKLTDTQLNGIITNLDPGLTNLVPYLTNSQANYLSLQIANNSQAPLPDNQIKIIQTFTSNQLSYLMNQSAGSYSKPSIFFFFFPPQPSWNPNPQAFTAEEAQAIVPHLTITQLIQTLPNLNSTALQTLTSALTSKQLSDLFTTKGLSFQVLQSMATLLSPIQKEGMTTDGIKSLNAIVSLIGIVTIPANHIPESPDPFKAELQPR